MPNVPDPLTAAADAISTASPKVRAFAQLAAKRIIALEQGAQPAPPPPTPPAAVGGLGLIAPGGTLSQMTHTQDGTYAVVIAAWDDAPALAKCAAPETYAYTVTTSGVNPGSEGGFVILDANPAGGTIPNSLPPAQYAARCVALVRAHPGLKGVFLDNCLVSIPGMVPALSMVSEIFKANGVRLAANVGGFISGNPSSDDGSLWCQWAAQVAPFLDRLILENWMNTSAAPYKLRFDGLNWDQHYYEWQKCVAVAPGKLMCVTYGPPEFGVYGRAAMLKAPGANAGNVFYAAPDDLPGHDPFGQPWTKQPSVPTIDPVAGTASL